MKSKNRKIKKNKRLVINHGQLETRVALLKDKRLEEYQIEYENDIPKAGSIYLGRIVNLESSLQAAFVDIGENKNAFLHYWDMIPAQYETEQISKRNKNTKNKGKNKGFAQKIKSLWNHEKALSSISANRFRQKQKISIKDIPKLFPVGTEILVQITKGPIGTKGARVTTNITIPGRYLVLIPYAGQIGLSKKISDKKERDRLRKILSEVDLPNGFGLIARTNSEGRKTSFIKNDLEMLLGLWHKVEKRLINSRPPKMVYREPNLLECSVRDFLTEDINEILVDSKYAFDYLNEYLKKIAGKSISRRVHHYRKAKPIFEAYRIKEELMNVFNREVQLPGGGYICIDETEALIAVDVNTGRGKKGKDQPETILQTNLEAADEVARQLRVRNIGGLLVIDFIDMRPRKHREQLLRYMRKLVKDDHAKSSILPISRFGLMEMTRQRDQESIQHTVFDACPYCNGRGRVKSAMTISAEIQRRLREILQRYKNEKDMEIRVYIHPSILARLKNQDADILINLEKKYRRKISFRGDSEMHLEQFRLCDPSTGSDL